MAKLRSAKRAVGFHKLRALQKCMGSKPTLNPENKAQRLAWARSAPWGTNRPNWNRWDRVIVMDECCLKLEYNAVVKIRLLNGERANDHFDHVPRRTTATSCIGFLTWCGGWMKLVEGGVNAESFKEAAEEM